MAEGTDPLFNNFRTGEQLSLTHGLNITEGTFFINVRAEPFGAKGDNETNDSEAVQSAIDFLAARGGGIVWFPAGSYILSDGIVIDTSECIELRGEGFQNTWLQTGPTATNTKLIRLNNGRHSIRDVGIVGCGGQGTYVPTASPVDIRANGDAIAVHIEGNCTNTLIHRCKIQGGFFPVLNEGADTIVADSLIHNCFGDANFRNRHIGCWVRRTQFNQEWPGGNPVIGGSFAARANLTPYVVGDVRSQQGFYIQCVTAGISGAAPPTLLPYEQLIQDGSVVWELACSTNSAGFDNNSDAHEAHLNQCDFSGAFGSACFRVSNDFASNAPEYIIVSDCVMGVAVGTSFSIIAGSEVYVTNTEISGGRDVGTACLKISDAFEGGLYLVNNTIYSGQNGISLEAGGKAFITQNAFGGITGNCISVAANLENFSIIGNDFSPSNTTGGNQNGIVIAAGTGNNFIIALNFARDLNGTDFSNGATGTNIRIFGNLDFKFPVPFPVYAVVDLPSVALVPQGSRAIVTDATVTTFASVVAGGGGNIVPVYSDGANWRIG